MQIIHTNNGNGEHLIDDGEMVGTFVSTGVYAENKLNLRFTYGSCLHVKNKGQKTQTTEAATVTWGGCYYAFENETVTAGHASVELHCPAGEKVKIRSGAKNAGRSPTRPSAASATPTPAAGPGGASSWRCP